MLDPAGAASHGARDLATDYGPEHGQAMWQAAHTARSDRGGRAAVERMTPSIHPDRDQGGPRPVFRE